MSSEVKLKAMTAEMYHEFFKEYENDMDLYLDKKDYFDYKYEKEKVDAYIQKQVNLNRKPFAIMLGEEIVGELKIYDIIEGKSAKLGITVKNKNYKDKGFGTQAEKLAVKYVFEELDIPVLYADSILTNTRSQHVLEKVGFKLMYTDEQRRHYEIRRKSMIELRAITKENFEEVLKLDVFEHQKAFVSSVANSLAQAYVYYQTAFPFAVYADNKAVGFIMLGYYEAKNQYTVWKFLIDKNYQNQGYGREALKKGIFYLKDRFNTEEIYLGVSLENQTAKHLYKSVGFEETGFIEGNVQEMKYIF